MIGIIDYGVGNIKSFANIYKSLNIDHKVVKSVDDFLGVTGLVLPGVGAFDYAMGRLIESGMREVLDDLVLNKNVPVLGICVGMQMLATTSEEGTSEGLGWIPGLVKKISFYKQSKDMPLPHMGWNKIELNRDCDLFKDMGEKLCFYFLHSYYFSCEFPEHEVASVSYGDKFTCMIQNKNIFGIQCHPEKSHRNGVEFLKNFGEYCASV